ncbi:MAG: SAM-dependent methyltransferase [Bacteroidetes bacterium B1(2017)]|nr:MAG: SAM-dependent methyltransferase [Bacteroidetes bacterium B1(2017)]
MKILPSIYHSTDGGKTLFREDLDETYHSRHGAIAESLHVFIKEGLNFYLDQNPKKELFILEIGFGTGLNAMLSLLEANAKNIGINYSSLETIPLPYSLVKQLDYQAHWGIEREINFEHIHACDWNVEQAINSNFVLTKIEQGLEDYKPNEQFDLLFFDAFAPDKQPELWELSVFEKLFNATKKGGVLVTYSSKGDVRRSLQKAGFEVEKIAGPPRKRHMLRAIKR